MLAYLLRTGEIDAALVARTGPAGGPFAPGFAIVDDPTKLRSRRYCSVYYPCDPFETVLQPGLRYAITLLPCQVERLRCLQQSGCWPQVQYVFGLLCHYVPRPEWTGEVCQSLGIEHPNELVYRGNGWPGSITAEGRSSPHLVHWRGNNTGLAMPRCHHCRRCCGESDWTCADPWGLKPRDVGDGKTLVRIHTEQAQNLTDEAERDGAIIVEPDGGLMKRRLVKHARRR